MRDKRSTGERFDAAATAYLHSEAHRQGTDLDTLATWCSHAERALDVAAGAGHTAGALSAHGVGRVVATDAAPAMVALATREYDVEGVVADAERLPFGSGVFDAVTCRIASHHFPEPAAFLAEVARVLVDGGVFAFEDNVAPDAGRLARFVDRVERRRDPTHVELVRPAVWRERFEAAGFVVDRTETVTRRLNFEAWCDRADVTSEGRRVLRKWFADGPPGAHAALDCAFEAGTIHSFVVPKRLFRLRTRG